MSLEISSKYHETENFFPPLLIKSNVETKKRVSYNTEKEESWTNKRDIIERNACTNWIPWFGLKFPF